MKKLVFILLFPFALQAQIPAVLNGIPATGDGLSYSISPSNIPAPSGQDQSPVWDIYKYVDFSKTTRLNNSGTNADLQIQWNSTDIHNNADPEIDDTTMIQNGDTIQSIHIEHEYAWYGVNQTGEMQLNGEDDGDDTATYTREIYFMKLSWNFNFTNGGKMPGLGGDGVNAYAGVVPSGGYYADECNEVLTPNWDPDMGFNWRGGWSGTSAFGHDSAIGYYAYFQNMVWDLRGAPSCAFQTYGQHNCPQQPPGLVWKRNWWYKIEHRLILNTVTGGVGNKDGIAEWYRDDTCHYSCDTIVFRNDESITLDYISNVTFPGGGDDPTRTEDMWIFYDDFMIFADQYRIKRDSGYVTTTPALSIDNRENN